MNAAAKSDTATRTMRAVYACRRQVTGLQDEAVWREFLQRVAGKSSLREMTGPEMGRVVDALHDAGAPRRDARDFSGKRRAGSDQARMIRGLWIELHQLGAVHDPSEEAINAFVMRQTGCDAMEWIDSLNANRVIEALKAWVARARAAKKAASLRDAQEGAPSAPAESPYEEAMRLWKRLRALGAVTNYAAADPAGYGYTYTGKAALIFYGDRDWEILLKRLRSWLAAAEKYASLREAGVSCETAAAQETPGDD